MSNCPSPICWRDFSHFTFLPFGQRLIDHRWWCSVAQLCLTLCDSMDCSMPGFPVLHHLLELAQIHVHGGNDAIQPSHLCCPLLVLPLIFPSIRVFSNESALRIRWPKDWASAAASVLPVNIQGWFPPGLTGLISLQSKGLSSVFSSTTVRRHQFFGTQPFLLSSSHTHSRSEEHTSELQSL